MTDNADTRESLLLRIRDARDRDAWYEFTSIYRPLIYRIGRRYGLQDADAQNLVQEVLQKIERSAEGWEPGQARGSFRRWLATVARNAAVDTIRRVLPDLSCGGTSVQVALKNLPDRQNDSEAVFHRELEREAFRWAARRIQSGFTEATWKAFWETMVEGISCVEAAAGLGLSVGAVYTARSRVMQRLKRELEHFDWNAEMGTFHSKGDES